VSTLTSFQLLWRQSVSARMISWAVASGYLGNYREFCDMHGLENFIYDDRRRTSVMRTRQTDQNFHRVMQVASLWVTLYNTVAPGEVTCAPQGQNFRERLK
jgi:hypothetical protein